METNVEMVALLAADPARTERNRTITYRWPLGAGVDDYGYDVENLLALTVDHYTSRKVFGACVRREQHRDNIMSTSVFAFISVGFTPVARYSAKAHQQAAEHALATLRAMADDPRLLELATTGEVTSR